MAARLKERYTNEVAPALAKEFSIKNPMAIPRLEKIVINMGLGEAIANAKIVDTAADELRADVRAGRLDAERAQVRRRRVELVPLARGDRHARPHLAERLGHLQAEAARAAGDQGDLAVELGHGWNLHR